MILMNKKGIFIAFIAPKGYLRLNGCSHLRNCLVHSILGFSVVCHFCEVFSVNSNFQKHMNIVILQRPGDMSGYCISYVSLLCSDTPSVHPQ